MQLQKFLYFLIACSVVDRAIDCAPVESGSTVVPNNYAEPKGFNTTISTRPLREGSIGYKILKDPHQLFIGRCSPGDLVLHQENIILYNDGKSHVEADIRVNVDANVYITCVKIYDEIPDGAGGYPSYVAGGVGHNFVQFKVVTDYGKGFHFFVQIYGYEVTDKANAVI